MTEFPNIRNAAVLYTTHPEEGTALSFFAQRMRQRGWNVGGLVQDILRDDSGAYLGVDVVALDTGDRFPIVRPSKEDLAAGTCGLDRAVLSESSSILRRAIAARVDLMVVEKFGEREQLGEGLVDDIMTAMAEGIPVLVAVPAGVIEKWTEFTGGIGDLLPSTLPALEAWWPRENLYEEMARSVAPDAVRRVIVGLNWILVEGPHGCGLAHTPARGTSGCRTVTDVAGLAQKNLQQLANLAQSLNPFETALGIAAINAFYNRYDLQGDDRDGLEMLSGVSGPVTVIGGFKKINEKIPNARVVEIVPQKDQYPQSAGPGLLASSEAAAITASTLINRSLPGLLDHCRYNQTVLVGPGTPLAPALFNYDIDILSGLVVRDVDAVAAIVSAGGSVKDIKPHCRYLTRSA